MDSDFDKFSPQESFNTTGNDPTAWFDTAASLLDSANIIISNIGRPEEKPQTPDAIWDWVRINYVSRMLRGMAVECLLKAVWLKSGEILASNGKFRNIPNTKSHDLYGLYKAINERIPLNFNEEELKFIARLSFASESARYPIRKSAMGSYPSKPNCEDPVKWNRTVYTEDEVVFDNIVNKLTSIIQTE